ncbi:hypothetical protein BS330_22050 [Amycolatopsis keratiniphila subsp. nogabecina]|nr:hypothetical protein BS330_22050 [Amycolatopsis keratiniphila subsp. nogabecina]
MFGLPMRLIEYVLVHEQAHATQPNGRAPTAAHDNGGCTSGCRTGSSAERNSPRSAVTLGSAIETAGQEGRIGTIWWVPRRTQCEQPGPARNPPDVELECCPLQRDTTWSAGRHDLHHERPGRRQEVDKEQHFELLRESAAEVKELQDRLQSVRDQEAALQAQRVTTLDELKKARDVRFDRMTAAIEDKVPKAQVARALGMDRTNLYKLLEGKETEQDTTAG